MNFFKRRNPDEVLYDNDMIHNSEQGSGMLFDTGKQFPPQAEIERLAKYERGRKLFNGKHKGLFNRASKLLRGTPHESQMSELYIACNIMDVICTKPSDLMYGDHPTYESGQDHDSTEQVRLESIVEENDLNQLGQELVIGGGYRGDSFLKTRFGYREDFSELPYIPDGVTMESIIETQDPSTVFPELQRGSKKKFKAYNIATVDWVDTGSGEKPFLDVERHLSGFIQYFRFELHPNGIEGLNTEAGARIQTYTIGDRVITGKPTDLIETGIPRNLVTHIPYKSTDDDWRGISTTERVEDLISAINDRLTQIDYILWKHTDPNMYGVDLDGAEQLAMGGKYIPVRKDEVAPSYMTWDSEMQGAFEELSVLLSLVYQISETPQWLFGTSVGKDQGGTGTSHTDGTAIRARFMPILSKVRRIRSHVDRGMRDALYNAMLLDNVGNEEIEGFSAYDAPYPKIQWQDGLPKNEKEQAEIMQIRTGGKATLDQRTAIKRQDNITDAQAQEVIDRIEEDTERDELSFVSPSSFQVPTNDPIVETEDGGEE